MKYIHSMWSKPATKDNFDNTYDVKYLNKNFYSYLLSTLLIKKMGYEIELYCDEKTVEYYNMIPYDRINVIDFDNDGVDSKFWIWGKIKTHCLMNEPYVHVDGDVFLFRDIIGNKLENYPVVVQSIENFNTIGNNFNEIYLNSINPFDVNEFGIDWNKYGLTAYNCGVIGFTDMNIKNEYANKVKEMLTKISTNNNFNDYKKKYSGMFLIAEQSLLYHILRDRNIKPLEILPYDEIVNSKFDWMTVAGNKGYCHMWGYSKYKDNVIEKIKYKIIRYFPEYEKILIDFEKKIWK